MTTSSAAGSTSVRGISWIFAFQASTQQRYLWRNQNCRGNDGIVYQSIQQAALIVVKRNFGMTRDDLVSETAKLLGHARTGDNVRFRIESGIATPIRRGIIHQNGQRLDVL